ncbi:MAG: pilus assembly protein [Hyphomicrobiaceae bacterium]|nr:pilus assembly protein [Hyphomicrobiaceae bacterium]
MRLRAGIAQWIDSNAGGVAINFAICLSVLLMLAGGTLDYTQAISQRSKLQAAVDAAALAAARELGLADAKRENVAAVIEAMVASSMSSNTSKRYIAPTVATAIRDNPLEVSVTARQMTVPQFGNTFGMTPKEISVNAVARIVGRPNICVLALDPSASGAIALEKNARVTGQNCAVFSNSTHTNSIKAKNSSALSASLICSAGGKDGGPGNFTPQPVTDCPTFDDPLASRPEPSVGRCNSAAPTRIMSSQTLLPGTYCGGLEIGGSAMVDLSPGVYVIKDGQLLIKDTASIKGTGVGLFMTGIGATVRFEQGSSIDLEAPTTGAMAGLLMFEARKQPIGATHEVLSDNARNLLGTLYFSRGRLHIDANNPVADKSAYTAVVARMLTLFGGPHLVLNSNYELTNVPVPEGIRGAAQPTRLVH